jgi:hypothetical protein
LTGHDEFDEFDGFDGFDEFDEFEAIQRVCNTWYNDDFSHMRGNVCPMYAQCLESIVT